METKREVNPNEQLDVNQVKPEFRFSDGRTARIMDMSDSEIQDAIHFLNSFLDRSGKTTAKMEKILSFLVMESSTRNYTTYDAYDPQVKTGKQVPIGFRYANK